MARVYLSLGSNIDRYRHIEAALDVLWRQFGELLISPVYESEAVGFDGDPFLNLVVGFDCDWPVGQLAGVLRQIEVDFGRKPEMAKFAPRSLDIDILTVDKLVGEVDGVLLPRQEITENAFVLQPLSDIAPDSCHPISGSSFERRGNFASRCRPYA